MFSEPMKLARKPSTHFSRLPKGEGNWEVGRTQYVTSQLLHVRFQPDKVRLVGLGFNRINPGLMDNTKWMQNYVRET